MDALTFFSLAAGTLALASLFRFCWYGIMAARHARNIRTHIVEYKRAIEAAHRRIT